MVLMVEQDLPIQRDLHLTDSPRSESSSCSVSRQSINVEIPLILQTLSHCAATFGTERSRFVRHTEGGEWIVHTLQQHTIITHQADQAEIAMAWTVGLSRFPTRVTRPRVTFADGSGMRPIAVTSYFGIPILCQDHFVGVIELAGNVSGDLERTLDVLTVELTRFGDRLTHDPALRGEQHIDLDVACELDGGFWSPNEVSLSDDEWAVLSTMGAPVALSEIVPGVSLTEEQLLAVTQALIARGLVTARARTRVLANEQATRYSRSGLVVTGEGA